MKIGGEYTFDGPQDLVWAMLLDPTVLARVLPGAERLDRTGENEYEGELRMKVGPIQGNFRGKVRLEDLDPPNGYTMQIDGHGAPGFVKATGRLKLSADGAHTRLVYDGDAQVGGKIASVGQRLIESSTRAIIAQSLEGLNAMVHARTAAAGTGGVAIDAAARELDKPTPAGFAASVAKQVTKDVMRAGVRKGAVATVVIVILLLIWLVLR